MGVSRADTVQMDCLKKKVVSVKLFLALVILLAASVGVLGAELSADCRVEQTCSIGQPIFSISDTTNAHASYDATTYPWKVCCAGTELGTSSQACSSDSSIFRMSRDYNAQVEVNTLTTPGYTSKACLGTNAFNCTYQFGACVSPLKCVVSISGNTNAHVGNCTAYMTKVCCGSVSSFPGECSEEDEVCGGGQNCCAGLYCSTGYCCPAAEQWNGTDCISTASYPSKIQGNVMHKEGPNIVPLDLARVSILGPGLPPGGLWAHTDENGFYLIGVLGNTLYDVIASKTYHEPNVTDLFVNAGETAVQDFYLSWSSSTCTAQCTRFNDICDATCDFWNGCFFKYGEAVKQACNGKQKSQVVEVGGTYYKCCTGDLTIPNDLKPEFTVSGDIADVVTVTRTVLYQGKPVKLKINVYNKK